MCLFVQDYTASSHLMQAVTVAASSAHKFEVKHVALGLMRLDGLVVGNPLLNGQGFFAGIHVVMLQKAQRNFSPLARATERLFIWPPNVNYFDGLCKNR